MATSGRIGSGATYSVWDSGAGPAAYVALGEVVSFTPAERTHERVEATHMGSGGVHEHVAGLIEPGDGSVTFNYVPGNATDVLLRTLLETGAIENHKWTPPQSGLSRIYPAAIITYSPGEMTVDGLMQATATFRASGTVTYDDTP